MNLAGACWPDLAVGSELVMFPLGSCEQHGPHLPFSTDTLIADGVAQGAADRLRRNGVAAWCAPALAFGASGEHQHFDGTVSIGHAALSSVILELGRSASGWAAIVGALAAGDMQVVAIDACADEPALPYALATIEELDALTASCPERIRPVIADVRDAHMLAAVVADAERSFGGVDIAVAAAGAIAGGRPLRETPADRYDAMFDINVRGVWNLAQAAVPALLRRPAQRSGRFVALASAAAHRGLLHLSAYCAAKHAVVGLVKGLAADLQRTGVTAVAVSPGATSTAMLHATAALYELDGIAALADGHLLGRVLEPAEIAATVRWLCSPDSAAITGTVVHADGGFTT